MKVSSFKGLNNVTDRLRLGLEWLAQADNVNISETGALSKRAGYSLARAGSYTSAYSTLDFSRLYTVDALSIKDSMGNAIFALTSSAPMFWTEVNENVYFNNGTDTGTILTDSTVEPWGTKPITINQYVGADGKLLDALLNNLPTGCDVIQHWKGCLYAAQYFPSENQTVVWFSQPLGFHMFSLDSDFIILPGRVLMLAPHDDALIIGTDARIYAYTDAKLEMLADHGVVPGKSWEWDIDAKHLVFWTARGLCAALPFVNLTQNQISVAPGVHAGGCLVRSGGQKRFVAVLQQGGVPFNAL